MMISWTPKAMDRVLWKFNFKFWKHLNFLNDKKSKISKHQIKKRPTFWSITSKEKKSEKTFYYFKLIDVRRIFFMVKPQVAFWFSNNCEAQPYKKSFRFNSYRNNQF